MRKSFKIKNLIRNNRYAFLPRGEERNLLPNEVRLEISGGGWTSPLLHSWGSLKKYGTRLMCASNEPTPSRISKFAGSLRNSALPLGEGGHSPLLHSGYPKKRNGTHYTILSKGEEKNLLANEMSLQILGGGQLCGSNEPTPSRISKFASSLRNSALPLGEGQTKSGGHSPLLYIGHPRKSNRPFSTSSRNGKECVRRALLPCGISNENWCGMTT